jgi:hypothetical protein
VWVSSTLATFLYHGGPEARGGFGDLAIKLDAAAAAAARTKTVPEVADGVFYQVWRGRDHAPRRLEDVRPRVLPA